MGLPNNEILNVIYGLLPGFITAWIFHSLTAHPKGSPFERLMYALIFTGLIKSIVIVIGALLELCGHWVSLGVWSVSSEYVVSILMSIFLGVLFSSLANTGFIHRNLPDNITKRTSYPSDMVLGVLQ